MLCILLFKKKDENFIPFRYKVNIMILKKENVWDYPRPAICQKHKGIIEVIVDNKTIAKTNNALRVIETSHPPTYYFPPEDVVMNLLKKNKSNSFCEWNGIANYIDLHLDKIKILNIGWFYKSPKTEFQPIKDYISFYASKAEKCIVNGEIVKKQEGEFYGGWITKNLTGPFKGAKGTSFW